MSKPSLLTLGKCEECTISTNLNYPLGRFICTECAIRVVSDNYVKEETCMYCGLDKPLTTKWDDVELCVDCFPKVSRPVEPVDLVNKPNHYEGKHGLSVREVIYNFNKDNNNLANATKYILRCEKKGTKEQCINKAIKYLQFELEDMKKETKAKI